MSEKNIESKEELGEKKKMMQIIDEEKLPVNLFGEHKLQPFEVVLKQDEGGFHIFSTSEKAGIQGVISNFTNESEAFDKLVYKARLMKENYHQGK